MRALLALLVLTPLLKAESPTVDPRLLATAKTLFKDLKVETLPNGLKVAMLPLPGSPVVTTMVAYKVGSGDEAKDQTGLSHYLEHLLFKGTDKLMPGDIDRATQRNGGHNNAYTNEDMTVYHFDFAADRWMQALEIEADRMRNCRIDSKHEFEQEKGAVIQELKGNEDRPWELEEKAILPRIFSASDPYFHPVIGEEAHVRGATAEIIKRYYDKWYHPNNATLVIVGGFDPAVAMTKVKELFGSIPKQDLPPRVPVPVPVPSLRTKQVRHQFESKFDVPRVMIGYNTVAVGEAEDYAFDVLSQALSGGRTGRLYSTLVEKEQVAAEASAANSAGRYPGWFRVQMEVLPGKDRAKAEKLLFAEIKKMADAPMTDAELKKVRQNLVASYIFGREGTHAMCDLIARSMTMKDLDYLTTYLDKVLAVTPADVQAAAKKFLNEESAVVVWSLPAGEGKGGDAKPAAPRRIGKFGNEGGGSGGFKLTDAKRVVLPNGLKLILLENRRLPIVVATASVSDVRLREPAEKSGVAALVGDMLEEGTEKQTGVQIAEAIESVGGSLHMGSSGGMVKVLTPDTDLGLKLLFDCLSRPAFPKDRLEAIREQLVGELIADETEPRKRASQAFQKIVYGDHPYGRPTKGQRKIVEKLNSDDCIAFHKSVFAPNNTTVVIVGDFNANEMTKKVEAMTADWKQADLPKVTVATPPEGKAGEKIISDKTAAQTHVFLGHLGIKRNDPDYYKLEVMDNVLGVGPGFTDRLSANLRDRQGLAYTVRASICGTAGEQPGAFTGFIGTFPDKYTWVRDSFLKEFRRIRDEAPTAQEVEDAKRYLLGSLPFRLETNGDVAGELLAIEKYGLGLDAFEKYKAAIAAVTPADVQGVAKKHLDPARVVVVAVGPIDEKGQPLKGSKKGGRR